MNLPPASKNITCVSATARRAMVMHWPTPTRASRRDQQRVEGGAVTGLGRTQGLKLILRAGGPPDQQRVTNLVGSDTQKGAGGSISLRALPPQSGGEPADRALERGDQRVGLVRREEFGQQTAVTVTGTGRGRPLWAQGQSSAGGATGMQQCWLRRGGTERGRGGR
jgi:hypothetical protein